MGKDGRADDDLAPGIELAVGFLLHGDQSQALRFELALSPGDMGKLLVEGFAGLGQVRSLMRG